MAGQNALLFFCLKLYLYTAHSSKALNSPPSIKTILNRFNRVLGPYKEDFLQKRSFLFYNEKDIWSVGWTILSIIQLC